MIRRKLTLNRILSATIRDNIVFSYEYDEVFYNLVLDGGYLPISRQYVLTNRPQLAH
jgi:hypothetical protein